MEQYDIVEFEVVDCGLEFSKYFLLCKRIIERDHSGKYRRIILGRGENFNDALDDAINGLCYFLDITRESIERLEGKMRAINPVYELKDDEWYYVGILYNIARMMEENHGTM